MPVVLTLLDGVQWHGRTIVGDRPQALLAALVAAGRAVRTDRLVDLVWEDDRPAHPAKALQVLVSRTRATVGADTLVTDDDGYRLAVGPDAVDATRLRRLAAEARDALTVDPVAALRLADEAAALAGALTEPHGAGPLAGLRRQALADLAVVETVRVRALSRSGRHAEALPALEKASAAEADDEGLLADLLRSEAAVRGPAAALDRYERHRASLRERLGTDPGSELQRVHRELLAADRPVREGVRYDASTLVGRDDDLRRVTALLSGSRVVSLVGPGGLGKTRLAHVVARQAPQPAVHVVELVGVTSAEDLVGEVGSALGVRDSVSGRRTLTPAQRTDVRARIAQHLDQAPTLLVLDNCEHLVDAVADLVAFLVGTTRELRVLTTSRAPLAIAAEHVYLLPQLDTGDSAALFRDRARATRPGVRLDEDAVAAVVARLDGLPLAIELAAAKVRVMTPREIAQRLEDRFALLRGGDRTAPDRHQTLLAVIDWSWHLLDERERRALRRLSAFHDGFTLDAASEVLGEDALDPVGELADQSLLVVVDAEDGTRYRMLETVREFGRIRLREAGDAEEARAALRRWAVEYAVRHGDRLFSADQVAAMDAMRIEETNLADVLREALAEPDPQTVTALFAALGCFWVISGDHPRTIAMAGAVSRALEGWTPEPDSADRARIALAIDLFSAMMTGGEQRVPVAEQLRALGPSDRPALRAVTTVLLATAGAGLTAPGTDLASVAALTEDPDPVVASIAWHWICHERENSGDPEGAIEAATRALPLIPADEGPWRLAVLHTQLSGLHAQFGDAELAGRHARIALPVLDRLGAVDDATQGKAVLAMAALLLGRRDEAAALVDELADVTGQGTFGGSASIYASRGQLALADGDVPTGLRLHREAVERLREVRFPGAERVGGLEPWVIFGEAIALSAFAQLGEGDDGADLYDDLRAKAFATVDVDRPLLDVPVVGLVLFGLGIWGLCKDALPRADAVRLLVLAERLSYHRFAPTMHWPRVVEQVEHRAPGVLASLEAEYAGRRGPDLLADARAALRRVL